LNYIGNATCSAYANFGVVLNGNANNTTGGTWSEPYWSVAPTPVDSGCYSFIGNGFQNSASGCYSFIGNGFQNSASGCYSSVLNGRRNTASGYHSTASGLCTTASGNYSTASGACTTASNYHSTASGYRTTASGAYSFVYGVNSCDNGNDLAYVFGQSIVADRANTTFVQNLSIKNIPISSAGLPSGSVWSNLGILTIVP
jgi:hypothetical protein